MYAVAKIGDRVICFSDSQRLDSMLCTIKEIRHPRKWFDKKPSFKLELVSPSVTGASAGPDLDVVPFANCALVL
jgi:hypothetical protein